MRRVFPRASLNVVASLRPASAKRLCSNDQQNGDHVETWSRDKWVASLPKDANRAPLDAIEPLLSHRFTPGQMHPKELGAYFGHSEAVLRAHNFRSQNKDAPPTDDEKYLAQPPFANYTPHSAAHVEGMDALQELQRGRLLGVSAEKKDELVKSAMGLSKTSVVARALAENYPKLWAEFIKCEGKCAAQTDEEIAQLENEDERALAEVCKFYKQSLPATILQKDGETETIVLPTHPLEGYWEVEKFINEGNLFHSTKSATQVAAREVLRIIQKLYQSNAELMTADGDIRILDAGCGAGNLGYLLRQGLTATNMLKSAEHPNRPDISLYGFDASVTALTFLHQSLMNTPPVPGYNMYNRTNKKEGALEALHLLDPCADREAFLKDLPPASFDIVVSCDFLMQDPSNAMPGMRSFYDCFDLVKPGGTLLVLNSMTITSPAVMIGYAAALNIGREGDSQKRLFDEIQSSALNFAVRRPPSLSDTAADDEKLEAKVASTPTAIHAFVKKAVK